MINIFKKFTFFINFSLLIISIWPAAHNDEKKIDTSSGKFENLHIEKIANKASPDPTLLLPLY